MLISRVVSGALLCAMVVTSFCSVSHAQKIQPTAYIGSDREGISAALAKDPDNLGLQMRIVEALLEEVKTASIGQTQGLMKQVEEAVNELIKADPQFGYPYRVLAKLTFRREQYAECLTHLKSLSRLTDLDYSMRSLRLKCLLEVGSDGSGVDAASEYVCNWFESGQAPSFGRTLGSLKAWVADDSLRAALLSEFEARHTKDPSNLNLALSYAGCLSAVGRNESAWGVIQQSERQGLCDVASGARHPIALMLGADCLEPRMADGYAGFNLNQLSDVCSSYPENISLSLRMALSLKNQAVDKSRKLLIVESRLKSGRDTVEQRAKLEEIRVELEQESQVLYRKALPYALAVQKANASIDVVPLMIGDIYYKLGDLESAVAQLERGIELLPAFIRLHEVLSQVHIKAENWSAAAEQLAVVCRVAPCRADLWNTDAQDSLLPVPKATIERMIVELMENEAARDAVIAAFSKACDAAPKNPNLQVFLSMMHYFVGNKAAAVQAMATAERLGMSGRAGAEHYLATLIVIREQW